MSRMLALAALAGVLALPFSAEAGGAVETRTVVVGNTAIVDVMPASEPGGPAGAKGAGNAQASRGAARNAMPLHQVLAPPPLAPHDR